jgi:cell wall-associated NlpC family hydrolase
MASYDPRITPARPDLAAAHLKGKVEAARYVEGEARSIVVGQAPLRRAPSENAALETEALLGERVLVYDATPEGWSWVQLQTDHYVGWMPTSALTARAQAPTHRVSALRTLIFPEASIKTPPIGAPPFGAAVRIVKEAGAFLVTDSGGHIPAQHLMALGNHERDFVAVAERFLHTPYLWGGKSNNGIDCSGLVQVAMHAAGIPCPRDSDMQEAALGKSVSVDPETWKRGDLIFWKGHVAIVHDNGLLHANAFHMAVAIEPVAEALARIEHAGEKVRTVRRLV